MHTKWCFCIFFFVITLKNLEMWLFSVFSARINFCKFVLAKNFAGISFRKIAQNLRNSCELLPAKISSFKLCMFTLFRHSSRNYQFLFVIVWKQKGQK